MIVPLCAVFDYKGESCVFAIEAEKAVLRTIQKGIQDESFVEIVDGLKEGELVLSEPDNSIKVLRGLKDVDEEKKLSTWIFRIAHNTCVDYHRSKKVNCELIDNINCYDIETNSPEYNLLNKEMKYKIKEVLFKISQKYQTLLLLRDFKNLSYREIASELKLNESTVKTLIYRARQQFQNGGFLH